MNDWTAAQAAEEWGLTIRRVQTLCIKGRVPGAWKHGRQWMIPRGTQKPEDLRQQKDTAKYLPGILLTDYITFGSIKKGLIPDSIHDEKLRAQYKAEIAYFCGDLDEAEKLFQNVKPEDPSYICACTIAGIAAIARGDSEGYHRTQTALRKILKGGNEQTRLLVEIAKATTEMSMFLSDKAPDWILTGMMDDIPNDCRLHAIYLRVRYLQSQYKYEEMFAAAQTALTMLGTERGPVIMDIYLRLCCAAALVQLGRTEEAERWLTKALEIGIPRGIISPFAEFNTILEGMMDKLLHSRYPEYVKPITEYWKQSSRNWTMFHNKFSEDEIALMLTAREIQIAFKASKGIPNADIAGEFSISVGRVKNILSEIYTKVGVSSRIELADKVAWNWKSD